MNDIYDKPVTADEVAALKAPVWSGVSEESRVVLLQAEARERAFDERRFALVTLSLSGVMHMLGNGGSDYFTFDGLPSDLFFVAVFFDPRTPDLAQVQVGSSKFAPVPDGERLPDVLIQATTWTKEEITNG